MTKSDTGVDSSASSASKGAPSGGDAQVGAIVADLLDGRSWARLCDALLESRSRVLAPDAPDAPEDRAAGFRYLARFLQAGVVSCVSHNDPDYPTFGRMIDYAMPWGLDNPDCLYLYAPLRGDAEYVVSGNRGSANHIDIQVNAGHYANGDVASFLTIDSLDGDDLVTDESGEFELTVGVAGAGPNALRTAANAQFMLIRQYFDDWSGERPADLLIDKVDAVYPMPRPSPERIAAQLELLVRWVERGGALWEQMSRAFLAREPNSLAVHRPEAAGELSGMRGQAYGMGNFECEPGEAVLIEFAPPRHRHMGISLANWWWEGIEYATHQCSLNGHQSQLSADGALRAVIAHQDPGVANWLDPAGNVRGTLAIRFLHADGSPDIRFERMPVDELEQALPDDTPRVTPEERVRVLAERRRAVLRRYRQ